MVVYDTEKLKLNHVDSTEMRIATGIVKEDLPGDGGGVAWQDTFDRCSDTTKIKVQTLKSILSVTYESFWQE